MQWRLSIRLLPIKLTIHGPVWMFLAEETMVPHKYIFLLMSLPYCASIFQEVWASCTFPFTLAREVAMSRVVIDGGEQHGMHCELRTLELIPNLRHTRLPQYLQVIN
jgi:hypothetical protein